MKKKLPWLKHDAKKEQFIKVQEEEKSFKKKMDDATKIWQDAKAPIEYVPQPIGFSSRTKISSLTKSLYTCFWESLVVYGSVFALVCRI